MTRVFSKIFSAGPFSAVRPYNGHDEPMESDGEVPVEQPSDGFVSSGTSRGGSAPPPMQEMRSESARTGMQSALAAFPQVVHLLVDPKQQWGESLSKEVGLPLISLTSENVDGLEEELKKPEYAGGFILEGHLGDADTAAQLDEMLSNSAPESRRVLSWELSDERHQEVLDHYINQDLLWMVPESQATLEATDTHHGLLGCLQGLPVLQ